MSACSCIRILLLVIPPSTCKWLSGIPQSRFMASKILNKPMQLAWWDYFTVTCLKTATLHTQTWSISPSQQDWNWDTVFCSSKSSSIWLQPIFSGFMLSYSPSYSELSLRSGIFVSLLMSTFVFFPLPNMCCLLYYLVFSPTWDAQWVVIRVFTR